MRAFMESSIVTFAAAFLDTSPKALQSYRGRERGAYGPLGAVPIRFLCPACSPTLELVAGMARGQVGSPLIFVDSRGSGGWRPTTCSITRAVPTSLPANPDDPAAWRDAIARTHQHRVSATRWPISCTAQQRAAALPSRHLGSCPTTRSAHRCGRHRSAGRLVRRPTVHAAESADRDSARRTGARRARRSDGRGVLDRRRRSRLGRSQSVRVLDTEIKPARHRGW